MIAVRRHAPRRGLSAAVVLVCLVVVTMISGAILKLGVAERDAARARERALQAEWLAQAGLERAVARLGRNPDYSGETWEIAARDLRPDDAGPAVPGPAASVLIAVQRPAGQPAARLIRVQADAPPDPARRARHSTQLLVELGSLKTGESR
jgi:hypothetical protein